MEMVIEMGMRAVMIIIVIVLILIISYGNCPYIYLLLYIYQFNATEYKVTPIIIVRVSSKCNRSPNAD